MDINNSKKAERIFCLYNVEPTLRRLEIFNILVTQTTNEFTLAEIDTLIRKEHPSAGFSSVVNTIKLFKNTGLVKEKVDHSKSKQSRRGRPKLMFTIVADISSHVL